MSLESKDKSVVSHRVAEHTEKMTFLILGQKRDKIFRSASSVSSRERSDRA